MIVVIEKNAKCTKYPLFNSNVFRVGLGKTVLSIKEELKQRINNVSPVKFDNECLFLYTDKRVLNTGALSPTQAKKLTKFTINTSTKRTTSSTSNIPASTHFDLLI